MAIPPGGIDETRRAVELGWCQRKHAEKAIRIAVIRASNGSGTIYYNALDILREKKWISDEGYKAVLQDRPRPKHWYEFWRKTPPPRNFPKMIQPEEETPPVPRPPN